MDARGPEDQAKPDEARRRCPICDAQTDLDLCPEDRMATLLIDAPPSDPSIIRVGSLIAGRYEVENVLGRGGFGAVFGARHTGTGQGIALKVLSSDEDDDLAMRRFFVEASVTSGLRHPNTIRVFDFGQDDNGLVYLAMEQLNGRTLKQELRRRRKEESGRVFTEQEAVEIGIAITRSLGEAHAAGLVHRDLKPDNIFLHEVEGDDPVVKVLDFGIVKLADGDITRASTSAGGGGPGTPAYMSPEQAKNQELDGRSDLYSLGCILFHLVTGTAPFRGETDVQTLYMHAHESVPDVRKMARVPLSASFVDVVTRALQKRPHHRFEDAKSMRSELRACLDDSKKSVFRTTTTNPVVPVDDDEMEHGHTLHMAPNELPRRAPRRRWSTTFRPGRKGRVATLVALAAAAFVVGLALAAINLSKTAEPVANAANVEDAIPPIAPESDTPEKQALDPSPEAAGAMDAVAAKPPGAEDRRIVAPKGAATSSVRSAPTPSTAGRKSRARPADKPKPKPAVAPEPEAPPSEVPVRKPKKKRPKNDVLDIKI